MNDYNKLIRTILINQRAVLFNLRGQIPLAKFDVEVICVASGQKLFTTHDIRRHFNNTTPQQVYRSIRRLVKLSVVELLQKRDNGKASYYKITEKGYRYLNDFFVTIENLILSS